MKQQRFNVTNDHLKLLDRMFVGWDDGEFGAPAIDCKRPYGDKDVIENIAEILNVPAKKSKPKDEYASDERYSESQIAKMNEIHQEMKTVLQILVRNAKTGIVFGTYVADAYGNNWTLEK